MPRPKRETCWLEKRADNGIWQICQPVKGKPKPRRISLGTRNAEEAEDKFAAFLILDRSELRDDSAPEITVAQCVWDYHDEVLSQTSASIPSSARSEWVCRFFGDMPMKDVTSDICHRYIDARQNGSLVDKVYKKQFSTNGKWRRPPKINTIKLELSILKSACGHAMKNKRISLDAPIVFGKVDFSGMFYEPPSEVRNEDHWLTREEVKQVFETARELDTIQNDDTYHFGNSFKYKNGPISYELYFKLLYYTASRKTAIEQLTTDQIKFDSLYIQLNPEGRKQTNKKRPRVPITSEFNSQLLSWVKNRPNNLGHNYIFREGGKLFNQKRFLGILKQKYNTAGIQKFHPHILRHTRACHLAQDGVDIFVIAGLLGDTIATTEDKYLHHCPDHIRSKLAMSSLDNPEIDSNIIIFDDVEKNKKVL